MIYGIDQNEQLHFEMLAALAFTKGSKDRPRWALSSGESCQAISLAHHGLAAMECCGMLLYKRHMLWNA